MPPCRADVQLTWEPDDMWQDALNDCEGLDLTVPHEVFGLVARDKRTGRALDSLWGIVDPGDSADLYERDMLNQFPESEQKECATSAPVCEGCL